jgi:predicted secreted protein
MKRSMSSSVRRFLVLTLTVLTVGASLSAHAAELTFIAAEKDGAKVWEGGGTIDLKGPVTLKVKNPLAAEHGFAIDTMKVQEVIKPGEEKTITVPLANIDQSASEHRVYCQLHPKHVPATINVAK